MTLMNINRKLQNAVSFNIENVFSDEVQEFYPNPYEVHFSNIIEIIFIPARADMLEELKNLYWTASEILSFKEEAKQEVDVFIRYDKITRKDAIRILYQPESEDDSADEKYSSRGKYSEISDKAYYRMNTSFFKFNVKIYDSSAIMILNQSSIENSKRHRDFCIAYFLRRMAMLFAWKDIPSS